MKTKLTEKQAWKVLLALYKTPRAERNLAGVKGPGANGLCYDIYKMDRGGKISINVANRMLNRIHAELKVNSWERDYLAPYTDEGDKIRCTFIRKAIRTLS